MIQIKALFILNFIPRKKEKEFYIKILDFLSDFRRYLLDSDNSRTTLCDAMLLARLVFLNNNYKGSILDITNCCQLLLTSNHKEIKIFLAVFLLIAILGFLYLYMIQNNALQDWMERASQKSSSIWTYGIITITFFSFIKYFWGN